MAYRAIVTEIGPLVAEFRPENMLIVFGDNAPPELREMCACHDGGAPEKDIAVDDIIIFDGVEYLVTAVGEEANTTFRTMGHCTFSFTGEDTAKLPGHIELLGAIPELQPGSVIEILHT